MRVLITGGAGFVGSHLAEALLSEDHEVFVIDDLSTGSIDNIEHLKTNQRFDYLIDSITDDRVAAEQIDRCDVVVHLAAAVGVRLIINEPVRTIETNVHGTEVILRHAAKKRKLVLVASTSEVYDKGSEVPFAEDDDIVWGPTSHARWAYACSKAIDEFLALAYWKEQRVPVIIARLFNTVGPRQTGRYGMVVPSFVRQALDGQPITVFGDGQQTRCFAYVGDVVQGLIGLIKEDRSVGQVFNVGNNDEISILDLAETIKSRTGSKSNIVPVPYETAYEAGFEDMRRRVPDLTKIRQLLPHWEPRVQLEGILDRVIAHELETRAVL